MPIQLAMPRRTRPLRLLGLVLTIATVAAVSVAASTQPASASANVASGSNLTTATAGDAESEFLGLLNKERVARSLQPLCADTVLAATSRTWSATMAGKGTIWHDPNLAAIVSKVEPDWTKAGENVGLGSSARGLHDAFMASTGHRANMLSTQYNRVGIGVVVAGSGQMFVTVRFLRGPAIPCVTGLSTLPGGNRTVLTGDLNGDGTEDALVYGPGTELDELWFGREGRTMVRVALSVSGIYRPVIGDFDGNGTDDVIWFGPGDRPDLLWRWNGLWFSASPLVIKGIYQPLAGDFDDDGRDDVLWYAPGTAPDAFWYGRADGGFDARSADIDGTYRPVVANIDGSAGDDIVWYRPGTGADALWVSTGHRDRFTRAALSVDGHYRPFGGDFDGDGLDDIFWYGPGGLADVIWYMTPTPGVRRSVVTKVNGTYLGVAGDFDGNGADDALWFSPTSAFGDPVWWGSTAAGAIVASTLGS